jgi:hypothetical protein
VFRFRVNGEVATSTHAGLPWLRYLRRQVQPPLHFWPFDGWDIPAGRSAVVEVYPRLWNRAPKPDGWTDDQYDAFVVAGQLQRADRNGRLAEWLKPSLPAEDLARASTEGWILGVDPKPLDDRKRSVRRPSRPAAGPDAARTSLIRPVVVRRVVSAGGDRARLGDVSAAMGTACAPCGTKALGTGLITVTLERPPRARGRQERTGPDLLCLR